MVSTLSRQVGKRGREGNDPFPDMPPFLFAVSILKIFGANTASKALTSQPILLLILNLCIPLAILKFYTIEAHVAIL